MSLVIPFLCIFNDLSESIPLKVKLSTIFILLRFISLQRQGFCYEPFCIFLFLKPIVILQYVFLTETEAVEV